MCALVSLASWSCTSGDAASPASTFATEVSTTTTPPPSEPDTPTAPGCPDLDIEAAVPLQATDLPEISGAARSARSDEAIWVHQDSGNAPVLHEVGLDGVVVSSWELPGAPNTDWEDLAAVPDGSRRRHLFVADTGNNLREREIVEVLRVPEPLTDDRSGVISSVATIRLRHPDTPADVEALLVDPHTGDLVLVTKELSGTARVLVAQGAAWAPSGSEHLLEDRGPLVLGFGQAVLAGDVSPDGAIAALRTPSRVLLWALEPDVPVADALLHTEPCLGPSVLDLVGEGLALLDDGYVLIGEGVAPELVIVR
jgi:hypothetical protein